MSIEKGDQIIIGAALEDPASRGTAKAAQVWIPGRAPSDIITVLEKKPIQETKATKFDSYGSEIVGKKEEGGLEFNLRCQSIGYLLKSLLGASTPVAKSSPNQAVFDHTFTINTDPQNPSLTLSLQSSIQAYQYLLALVSKLEIKVSTDDLIVAVASFLAKSEEEHDAFSPSFSSADYYFRHQDAKVKIAANLVGLDAAEPLVIKDFSLGIDNKARVDPAVGNLNPADVLGIDTIIEGTLSGNYKDKSNYDIFKAGDYKAMRLEMERADITIGSNMHPKLKIDLPRVSFEKYDPDRPLDDIVSEGIGFKAHYSEADTKGIEVVLTNLIESYVFPA